MKAIVGRQYGGPEVLKLEEVADPVAGPDEVLVQVAAVSINPADLKQRSGAMKDVFPIDFPGLVGLDVSGTVRSWGSGVTGFAAGDRVFAMAGKTYAELCVVKASDLAHVPAGLDLQDAAALPVITTTGNQLVSLGTEVKAGQTVLVSGAVGNVGRAAVLTARKRGAQVIAAVLSRQTAAAETLGADSVVALDDPDAVANLALLDAVADTVGGKTAEALLARVKDGGVFASVLGAPANAMQYPRVRILPVYVTPDATVLLEMAAAVTAGELTIPIGARLPLRDADKGHAMAEKGGAGKILLVNNG